MAEESRPDQESAPPPNGETDRHEAGGPSVRRRDFLVGAGAGAAVVGVVGAGILATRAGPTPPPAVPVQATAPPLQPTAVQAVAPPQPTAAPPPVPVPQPTGAPNPAAESQTSGIPLTLKVNGITHTMTVQPNWTLLYVLREKLDLTGTKYGCDRGMCGMCTVVADGKAIYSCMNLVVQHDGAEVRTVEGLAQGELLHPLQQAFLDENAFQCAWCTPGFLMSAHALLQVKASPTLDEIKAGVAGNACRCGTYPRVFQAIDKAAGVLRNPPQAPTRPLTPGAPVAG